MSDAPAAATNVEYGAPTVAHDQVEDIGHKVFAGNLAYSTTDDGLKTFFAAVVSDIISATVIMRGSRSAGYGFVALPTLEAAEKAVAALNKAELDGRHIIVEVAKPADQKEKKEKKFKRRVGRRGAKAVTGEVTEAEANGNASEAPAAGGTDEVDKPKKFKKKGSRKPKTKRAGGDGEAAPAAAEGEEGTINPQPARTARIRKPRAPRPPRPSGEDPVGEPSKNMLFVANLGFNIDDAGLQALFTDAGINVITARVVRRNYGKPRKSKGYGFVDVGNEDEQEKAIAALNDKEFEGRKIAVKVAVNTPHEDDEAGVEENNAEGAEAPAAAA